MNNTIHRFLAAATAALALTSLTACGSTAGTDTYEGKEVVSVALWGNQLLEDYAPWLQEQFPDVAFDFYIINNSTDYYRFRAEKDDLPDILTVRRFSLRDVEELKDDLLDLSDTALANTFYQSYLRNYSYDDGTVNWLPACAEIDDLIVNKTLFEQYDIPLPTDYDSFVYACEEFEKNGIIGYVTDMTQDYTCMETLQGFAAAQLTSAEGRAWRQEYESGATNELDEDVWLPAFEKMESLIEATGMDAETLELSTTDVLTMFDEGKVAMYRGTGADLTNYGTQYERLLMPYPGDTEEDSWYLTYPAFQTAINAESAADAERETLLLDIMTAMLSEEGLSHIANGQNMVAYNKDVNLELLPELSNLDAYIENNRMYIRLASSAMFSISQDVVQRMLTGELATAQEAYDEFNSQLQNYSQTTADTVAHLDTDYSRIFSTKKGNEAASAVYNTLRDELGVDCLLGTSSIIAGNIFAGDYTEKEISYLINWDAGQMLSMELTGERLGDLVQYLLTTKGTRDSVVNDSTLPVSSGFEMTIAKADDGSYTLEKLTINGAEINADQTYSVVLRMGYSPDITLLEEAGYTDYEILEEDAKTLLSRHLIEKQLQLSQPTSSYIALN